MVSADEFTLKQFSTQCHAYLESLYPIMNEVYSIKLKQLLQQHGMDLSKPTTFAKGTMYLILINEEVRNTLSLDDVLCLFLIDVAESSIVNYYKLVACFVQLLRNCINQNGFEVVSGIKPIEPLE